MPLPITRGAASAKALGFTGQVGGGGLYPFTTFTFSPYSDTSPYGPDLASLLTISPYNTASWTSNTSFFNVIGGVQFWTVPKTGVYSFLLSGAAGGNASMSGSNPTSGGYPAIVGGRLSLTQGDIIKILVGQKGTDTPGGVNYSGGGGGGGTFVATSANSPLFVAAGGMGATADNPGSAQNGTNGSYTGTKNAAVQVGPAEGGTGGSAGNGGVINITYPQSNSAGGGFYTNGDISTYNPYGSEDPGKGFVNNGQGGVASQTNASDGGYGGGGVGAVRKGGAGGGYSGGNGSSTTGIADCNAIGQSATSYLVGSATNTTAYQSSTRSAGYVVVTFIS